MQLNEALDLQLDEEAVAAVAEENSIGNVAETIEALQGAARRRDLLRRSLESVGLIRAARAMHGWMPAALRLRPVVDEVTGLHHNHISAGGGVPGKARKVLSAEQHAEILKHFGEWMARLGYAATAHAQSAGGSSVGGSHS